MTASLPRVLLIGLIGTSTACSSADIFAEPENLKVLPDDITPAALRATMRGFSFATGYRCEGCHVGEAGKPLTTFDFAADEKDTKEKAREMLKMVADINQRLDTAFASRETDRIEVGCMTCHRGQDKPIMLDDLLVDTTVADGARTATDKYRELRAKHYGSHTFDFSEMTLITVAERLAPQDNHAAMTFLDLNLEFHPQSWMTLLGQGQLLARGGDKPAARAKLNKALEIAPDNPYLQRTLGELDHGDSAPE